MMNRPPLEQRVPLTLDQLRALEDLQTRLERKEQKVVLVYLLAVLHVRCRFSDAMFLRHKLRGEPTLDEEGICLLEIVSLKTMTNQLGVRRVPVLLVGLGRGASDKPWTALCPQLLHTGVIGT
eukprot:3249356-Amphidinium_carterae.1